MKNKVYKQITTDSIRDMKAFFLFRETNKRKLHVGGLNCLFGSLF